MAGTRSTTHKVDKLDNAIKQLSEVSEDYECNQCKADMLDLMRELKHWRENPFRMIYRRCKKRTTAPGCKKCPWYKKCNPVTHNMPDSWY